jgi:3-methyladenine DNA glycosylase/8-oxoguanine DNA glycosylase
MIQTVMQQLIEWREAENLWRKMVHHFGHPAPGHQRLRIPPSYKEIASMDLSVFQKLGLSMKRGAVIRELGRIGHRLDAWHDEPIEVLRRRLLSIPGIGPWTVDHCLGFSLGADDVVPFGDYQLPHTVCWALADEPRGDDERMAELLKPWHPRRWSVLRLIFAANLRVPRRGPRIDMGNAARPSF